MPKRPRAVALGWYGGAPLVLYTFFAVAGVRFSGALFRRTPKIHGLYTLTDCHRRRSYFETIRKLAVSNLQTSPQNGGLVDSEDPQPGEG
jgi:hypothetical protein